MSRIQCEKAKAVILSLYQPNREWPHLSYFAHCPTDWPQHFAPVHLAHLQAPPIGKDRSHTTAWQAAIESAAGAGELPNVLQPFNRVRGATVHGPADKLGHRRLRWEAQCYTKDLPGIAAGDFQTWLKSQGETASEHIAAWFDARCTAPTQTPAPVETVEQRRTRYLGLFEVEVKREKRGALQRVADSEGVDRSNLKKDIDKARAARATEKRAGMWASQLVTDGKRKG